MCQHSFFLVSGTKVTEKSENLQKKLHFEKLFAITEQLFAKLLSRSSNTVGYY